MVDEAERSMHDALMVVKDGVQRPAIAAGGGSTEAYVSQKLGGVGSKASQVENIVQSFHLQMPSNQSRLCWQRMEAWI